MVVGLLPTAVFAADDVEINEANFPDANFRRYVQTEFDTDKNDRLSSAEIAAVKQIIASTKGIKNLKGIEFFTALETLNCVQCELTALDVSKNTKLEMLDCESDSLLGSMRLTELDVSQNKALKELNCWGIKMQKLNVSGCTALEKLDCGGNQLTALDVSENTNLTILRCESNHLAELDVSQNSKLERLYCRNNMLAVLDVSKNSKLARIDCGKNGLTSLNLDQNEKIEYVNLNDYQFANKGTLPAGVF